MNILGTLFAHFTPRPTDSRGREDAASYQRQQLTGSQSSFRLNRYNAPGPSRNKGKDRFGAAKALDISRAEVEQSSREDKCGDWNPISKKRCLSSSQSPATKELAYDRAPKRQKIDTTVQDLPYLERRIGLKSIGAKRHKGEEHDIDIPCAKRQKRDQPSSPSSSSSPSDVAALARPTTRGLTDFNTKGKQGDEEKAKVPDPTRQKGAQPSSPSSSLLDATVLTQASITQRRHNRFKRRRDHPVRVKMANMP